jgi:hypothetical protein
MASGPTYKGNASITRALSYKGIDEQLRKLERFDAIYLQEMGNAMDSAVGIVTQGAKADLRGKIKGVSTGALEASIYGKRLSTLKGTSVRGAIGTQLGLKAFAQEVGRFYGNAGAGTTHYWSGKFYLYFGAKEKKTIIEAEYQKANERIVKQLVVKA